MKQSRLTSTHTKKFSSKIWAEGASLLSSLRPVLHQQPLSHEHLQGHLREHPVTRNFTAKVVAFNALQK